MPRVSVLFTSYNHRPYLREGLEGLMAQTFEDWEAFLIDDGSTDGSREELTEYVREKSDPRLNLAFTPKNLGTYGALNHGLGLASGEFVAIYNDDDVWMPDKLSRQVEMLDAHPEIGLVHTNGWFIGAQSERLEGVPLGFDFPKTATGDLVLRLVRSNSIIASAVVARRACFEQLGPFDELCFGSGDWDMWLRIAEQWHVGYLDEPLTLYRWHTSNASKKLDRIWQDDQMLRERIVSRESFYRSKGYEPSELSQALAHNWACLGTVRTLNGDPRGGRSAYAQSLRLSPSRFKSAVRWAATFLPRSVFRRFL